MAISSEAKREFLSEHLPYEKVMLDYTLIKIKGGLSQFDWNVYFESFTVHARLLYRFLTNNDKPNARALDFVSEFKHPITNDSKSIAERLNGRVTHFGLKRADPENRKPILKDAENFKAYLDKGLEAFENGLVAEDRAIFVEALERFAANSSERGERVIHGPTSPDKPPPSSPVGPDK